MKPTNAFSPVQKEVKKMKEYKVTEITEVTSEAEGTCCFVNTYKTQ